MALWSWFINLPCCPQTQTSQPSAFPCWSRYLVWAPSIWEAEASWSLSLRPGSTKDSHDHYMERPCLEKQIKSSFRVGPEVHYVFISLCLFWVMALEPFTIFSFKQSSRLPGTWSSPVFPTHLPTWRLPNPLVLAAIGTPNSSLVPTSIWGCFSVI